MRGGEGLQGGQLDHGLGLAFEKHRQHNQIARRRFAEAGVNSNVIRRSVGKQHPLFLQSALADQAFTDSECLRIPSAGSMRVAGQQLEVGTVFRVRRLIDRAVLGVDEGRQLREEHLADGDQVALAL